MEEGDDEFGDLYTDVLRPLSSPPPPPHHPSPAPPPSLHRPVDLNLNNDEGILTFANKSADSINFNHNNSARAASGGGGATRVLSSSIDENLQNYPPSTKGDRCQFQFDKQDKDINFDIEGEQEDNSAPVIPGLSVSADVNDFSRSQKMNEEAADVAGGGEDWEEDSDSEDDLQIVLNDNGPMGMERGRGGGITGDDDDGEDDEDPLVIVADGDVNQAVQGDQDWGSVGEDVATAGTGVEGERKEGGGEMAGKGGNAPKIGYSNHLYHHHHPFHSQFKYVRPGAALMPGAVTSGPGGAPGQIRPPVNMASIAGRGRGDWRPTGAKHAPLMQKGYHAGFGMPWGNNMAGRDTGGGLEFTLPSHKTIFEVDIDSFEEKPWKYPGVDISDFFNFGLNEDSWKDYCKQLEQHRLETTMQSKIRVYESGRAEQEYDPDLPPELAAAAAGMHDAPADSSNLGKSDVGQSDSTKGPVQMRPPLPTGRAIQVGGGYGERLPSIDTRPPRIRDSDAIIEIVLQDSKDDDSSTGNGGVDGASSDPPRDNFRESEVHDSDMAQVENDYFDDDSPQGYDDRKGGRSPPFVNSGQKDGNGMLPFHPEAPSQYCPGSRGQPVTLSCMDFAPADEERRRQERRHDRSPDSTPGRITQDKRFLDNDKEESGESVDGKQSPFVGSPAAFRDAREQDAKDKDVAVPGEPVLAELSAEVERNDVDENEGTTNHCIKDGEVHHYKKQKLNSHDESSAVQELDHREDLKAARSSEDSKARSASSKDYEKWPYDADEEVVQDAHARHLGTIKRHVDDIEPNFRRKEHGARQDREMNYMSKKGREGSYPRRDSNHHSLAHHSHMRNEGYDRRQDRESLDGVRPQMDEDPHSRKRRTEDTSKRERREEMASRHKSKVHEGEMSDKEEHLYSKEQMEYSNYRVHYDKDGSLRHREREDSLKNRYDIVDDSHSKRRKDKEDMQRDYRDKEEILHGHRETTNRQKRERDDILEPRKRVGQRRVRDSPTDYHSVGHKDEVWLQRERGERQRERELYRLKQTHEENLSKREKEGRGTARSGRGADDKAWMNHNRGRHEHRGSEKEYQSKDAVRNSEQQKRRDRADDESYSHHRGHDDSYARGHQLSSEERRSKQERPNVRTVDSLENQRGSERKHKDNTRKSKDSEAGDQSTLGSSRRYQEDQSVHTSEMGLKGSGEQGNGQNDIAAQHNPSRRRKEDASSDEEQHDSRRGRSKLERWTSHKERDYSINSKSSASLMFKEMERNNNGGSVESKELAEEQLRKRPQPEEKKDTGCVENKDSDTKPLEDRHLDTVEKLKKRSERFKLPMPSEKDASTVKKMESQALPCVKTDTPVDLEIKQERPARKRRWISS